MDRSVEGWMDGLVGWFRVSGSSGIVGKGFGWQIWSVGEFGSDLGGWVDGWIGVLVCIDWSV